MKIYPLLTAGLVCSLVACGGGSSGSGNQSSSVVSSSVVSVASSQPSSVVVSSSSSVVVEPSSSSQSSDVVSSVESSSSESSVAESSESSVAESSESSQGGTESSASSESSSEASSSVAESSVSSSEQSSAESSESSSSETSSEASSSAEALNWNVYSADYHPATNGSVTLAGGEIAEFTAGGNGDYFVDQFDGTVVLDTSSVGTDTTSATFYNVVNAEGVYPKYFTLVAGVKGNADSLRVLELEVAMADEAQIGSRLKAILRNDGSNKGVQLETANNGSSVNSYNINDMDKFAIYQIAITLTSSTNGSVNVYRNGVLMPGLSLDNVTMRATSAASDNFVRFGEVSGSAAYKSTVDWVIWTNQAAYSPLALDGLLPAGLGCVYGYGSSDQLETCENPPVSGGSSSSSGGANSSAASSIDHGTAEIRPAKIEGFAAYANVTGGAGGPVITVTTGTELNAALCGVRNGNRTAPVIIMVDGTINHSNTTSQGCDTQNDVIEIKNTSNISIIGVGTNALFDEIGIHVRSASNIIIQNVHIRNVKKSGSPTSNGGDAIGMETNVDRVWIDHNWLEASGGEKDGYDSLLDMKAGVTNVTVSYNIFNDSSRAGLIGSSDSDNKNNNITFHHNWYRNIEQRTPLIRHSLVHIYNNYWSNENRSAMIHGINSRMNAKALVESNYFYNVNNPLLASNDSSVAGCWQTNNDNTLVNHIYSRGVGSGALVIPEIIDGQMQSTCEVTVPYTVDMDPAVNVPAIVMANAGVGIISTEVGSSSSSSSSSSVSSQTSSSGTSSSSPSAGTGVLVNEEFGVDKATLFSATYKAVSTDSSAALYFVTGGNSGITVVNDQLSIVGGRFTIGHRPPRTATTASDLSANGDFDLTSPYRISFTVVSASGAGKVQVYVDNNTTSQGNSLHSNDSKVYEVVANTLTAGQVVEITPSSIGTSTSFIAIRAESSATIVIDDLKLEYID